MDNLIPNRNGLTQVEFQAIVNSGKYQIFSHSGLDRFRIDLFKKGKEMTEEEGQAFMAEAQKELDGVVKKQIVINKKRGPIDIFIKALHVNHKRKKKDIGDEDDEENFLSGDGMAGEHKPNNDEPDDNGDSNNIHDIIGDDEEDDGIPEMDGDLDDVPGDENADEGDMGINPDEMSNTDDNGDVDPTDRGQLPGDNEGLQSKGREEMGENEEGDTYN